ncbi:HOMEZ protein, partial [Polypterus senegalus]
MTAKGEPVLSQQAEPYFMAEVSPAKQIPDGKVNLNDTNSLCESNSDVEVVEDSDRQTDYNCHLCDYETKDFKCFSDHQHSAHLVDNVKRTDSDLELDGKRFVSEEHVQNGEPGMQHVKAGPEKSVKELSSSSCNREMFQSQISPKADSQKEGTSKSGANFSTNHNSVVCLPLVSEGLKLVWTQSDQTSELDSNEYLKEAFNKFPYPSASEISLLCLRAKLPLDKVKVWFMVQRIKYGISWSSEEIEETRLKLRQKMDSAEQQEELNGTGTTPEESALNKMSYIKSESDPEEFAEVPIKRPRNQGRKRMEGQFEADAEDIMVDMPCSSSNSGVFNLTPGRYKKSKAQLATLRASFSRQHFPNEAELRRLQQQTGLSRNDIRKWFSDSRYQMRNSGRLFGGGNTGGGSSGAGSSSGTNSSFFESFLSRSLEASGYTATSLNSSEGPSEFSEVHEESIENSDVVLLDDEDEEGNEEKMLHKEEDLELQSDETEPMLFINSKGEAEYDKPHHTTSTLRKGKKNSSTPPLALSKNSHELPGTQGNQSVLTPSGRPRKTKEQLNILKSFFLQCQWPKSADYTRLVQQTGLPRPDVIQWFGDTRYAVKNGQLRWVRGSGVGTDIATEIKQQQNQHSPYLARSRRRDNSSGSGRGKVVVDDDDDDDYGGLLNANSGTDIRPLEKYLRTTGYLQEKDLDQLCKKSHMTYQQVRDWFLCQQQGMAEVEVDISDGDE